MAVDPRLALAAAPRVQRFGLTERRLHTLHAVAFSILLATGFVLYPPFLAQIVFDRPLVTAIRLVTAVGWLAGLALVAVLGDRAALRETRREIERFDADDVLFVRRRRSAAGRFNGGQKAHASPEAGLSVLNAAEHHERWRPAPPAPPAAAAPRSVRAGSLVLAAVALAAVALAAAAAALTQLV